MLDIVQILTDPDIFPKALESLYELRYKATAYNRHNTKYNEAKSSKFIQCPNIHGKLKAANDLQNKGLVRR